MKQSCMRLSPPTRPPGIKLPPLTQSPDSFPVMRHAGSFRSAMNDPPKPKTENRTAFTMTILDQRPIMDTLASSGPARPKLSLATRARRPSNSKKMPNAPVGEKLQTMISEMEARGREERAIRPMTPAGTSRIGREELPSAASAKDGRSGFHSDAGDSDKSSPVSRKGPEKSSSVEGHKVALEPRAEADRPRRHAAAEGSPNPDKSAAETSHRTEGTVVATKGPRSFLAWIFSWFPWSY